MKYPAIAVTALAALYAAGWVGALLLVTTVVALWAAGEPSSVDEVEADAETRLRRELARHLHPTADHHRKADG